MRALEVTVRPSCGVSIRAAVDEAQALANLLKKSFEFKFNDTEVTVTPGGCAECAMLRWELRVTERALAREQGLS